MFNPFKKLTPERISLINDLEKILSLINTEDRWCRRALLRDKEGNQLFYPDDEKGYSYCILGAGYKQNVEKNTLTYLNSCAKANGFLDITKMNDTFTYPMVILFLTETVKLLKRKK